MFRSFSYHPVTVSILFKSPGKIHFPRMVSDPLTDTAGNNLLHMLTVDCWVKSSHATLKWSFLVGHQKYCFIPLCYLINMHQQEGGTPRHKRWLILSVIKMCKSTNRWMSHTCSIHIRAFVIQGILPCEPEYTSVFVVPVMFMSHWRLLDVVNVKVISSLTVKAVWG